MKTRTQQCKNQQKPTKQDQKSIDAIERGFNILLNNLLNILLKYLLNDPLNGLLNDLLMFK